MTNLKDRLSQESRCIGVFVTSQNVKDADKDKTYPNHFFRDDAKKISGI